MKTIYHVILRTGTATFLTEEGRTKWLMDNQHLVDGKPHVLATSEVTETVYGALVEMAVIDN